MTVTQLVTTPEEDDLLSGIVSPSGDIDHHLTVEQNLAIIEIAKRHDLLLDHHNRIMSDLNPAHSHLGEFHVVFNLDPNLVCLLVEKYRSE
jgi:hypothetical protein